MSAALAATFESTDRNHDGVVSTEKVAAALAPEVEAMALVGEQPVETSAEQPGLLTEQPLVVTEQPVAVTEQPAVLTYTAPTYVQPSYVYSAPQPYVYSAPQTYVYSAQQVYSPAVEKPFITLTAGLRVVYTSRSNGQKYPGTVMERIPTGWLLKLDVDGGLKEVEDVEVWRVEYETTAVEQAAAPENDTANHTNKEIAGLAKEKKSKKAKASKGKGCC
eukprot:TRINITY_DN6337_c0_g1_i2.p1 TRINITY_DN6337_c0_g1~~TRINITY_DN6337_c0_g1_i2.p1  ORF type:complete len:245 (-),score=66.30 TRINITY_DN6337_c0_g1_i2:268-924(-)